MGKRARERQEGGEREGGGEDTRVREREGNTEAYSGTVRKTDRQALKTPAARSRLDLHERCEGHDADEISANGVVLRN